MKRCAKEDLALREGYEPESAGNGPLPGPALTLRRSRFFTFTQTQKDFVTARQEYELARLVKENDPSIRQIIIVQHLRTVVTLAKRYTDRGLEFVDLVREGNDGLISALEKFEPEGDLCLPSFVERCVCRSIERAIMDQHIPANAFGTTAVRSFSIDDAASRH